MKNKVISFLQSVLGFKNYLFVFSLFTYYKLRWDKNEKDFLQLFHLIKEDGIVLDIGANIGVMTAHLAKHLPNSEVFSFEPIMINAATIKRIINYFKLNNVRVFEIALSNHEGELEMIMPEVESAKKQGLTHVVNENNPHEKGERFRVPVKILDQIPELSNANQRVTAIKIDVEGHELNVLKGAVNLITKNRPVIYCELWENEQRREMFEFMNSLGYKPKVIDQKVLCDFTNQRTQNFFFVFENHPTHL